MNLYDSFKNKLEVGQRIECAVRDQLQKLLPDCTVFVTRQDDPIERFKYNLGDVVVHKDGHTILGIECKRGNTKLKSCWSMNGWSGVWNTPINRSSWKEYQKAFFPVYVINLQEFAHKVFVADVPTIKNSKFGLDMFVQGRWVHNIDSRGWTRYEDDVTLSVILMDILKKEGIC